MAYDPTAPTFSYWNDMLPHYGSDLAIAKAAAAGTLTREEQAKLNMPYLAAILSLEASRALLELRDRLILR